jgi:hypothetical protein
MEEMTFSVGVLPDEDWRNVSRKNVAKKIMPESIHLRMNLPFSRKESECDQ